MAKLLVLTSGVRARTVIVCFFAFLGMRLVASTHRQVDSLQKRDESPKPRTVVDLSEGELRDLYGKDLDDVKFDRSLVGHDTIVQRVAENVSTFFRDIVDNTSRERVTLQKNIYPGVVKDTRVTLDFRYLILGRVQESGTAIIEDRVDVTGQPVRLNSEGVKASGLLQKLSGFVVTYGFAGHCIFFHPSHVAKSSFRYLGKQSSGSRALLIAFAQKPEARDYLVSIDGKRVLLQGFAWIDPRTFQILRIRTDLLEHKAGDTVTRQTTEITFAPVRFKGVPQLFQLPREVIVTLDWGMATYRNVHRYSDWKLFTVDTRIRYEKTIIPQIKK